MGATALAFIGDFFGGVFDTWPSNPKARKCFFRSSSLDHHLSFWRRGFRSPLVLAADRLLRPDILVASSGPCVDFNNPTFGHCRSRRAKTSPIGFDFVFASRSEEHTSELQSR